MDSEGHKQAQLRRRVLITGSSRGIGLELARQYEREGYDVIATCRDPDKAAGLHEVVDAAANGPGSISVHRLNIMSEPDLEAVVAALDGAAIDILVGNAAAFGGTRSHFPDLDFTAWRRVHEVNVIGSIRVAMALWRNVAASTERKIVFVSSRAGLPREATPGRSYIYGSSKAALNSAARCLALDLAPEGVIAALVNPGHVQTGIGGAHAPMTAAESVTNMRAVIANLTADDAGKFLHYDGTELKL
jgi:NAD(P)-dependent dehydrogenase (short-subunit alcohol dehydrogenase family)